MVQSLCHAFCFSLERRLIFPTCSKIYEAAVRGLSPVNCPLPVKFPLPDPRNPFSLKPGSISALTSNLKASEVDKSSSISLAIAGAQAAATQFSKKDENSHSTAWNNAPTNMNANNEDTEVARSYNLRSRGRSTEKDNISSTELNMKFGDLTLPSYHKEKSRSNESEGSSKQNRSPGAEADLMISRIDLLVQKWINRFNVLISKLLQFYVISRCL